MRKVYFIARKELYHILRDGRSLTIVFVMPLLMVVLYGYAINLDIEHVSLAIIDHDNSPASRELVSDFYDSPYFHRPSHAVAENDPDAILRSGHAAAVMIIRPGFAKAIATGEHYQLGMMIDGADANMAAAVQGYSNQVLAQYLSRHLPAGVVLPGVVISPNVLYNPDLQSAQFFVPGLTAIILLMISALLTSVTIARERETGTMEQLLTAPVTPAQILIGKLLPYLVIAFIDGIIVLLFAKLLFNVPLLGSPLLLLGFGFVYIATSLAIGILISSLVKTQQVAMMIAVSATLLPSVMLSGFIFAIKIMPLPLQALSYIIPARYFVTIVRGIMLKGAGLSILAVQGLALVVIMTGFIMIAVRKFTTRVG